MYGRFLEGTELGQLLDLGEGADAEDEIGHGLSIRDSVC
jgi:hypothetical protein